MISEAKLILQKGDAPGQEFLLETVTVIGRSSAANIVLADGNVSKLHAELRQEGDAWLVTDLNSTNGTFLGGQRLAPNLPARITSGSVLRVGHTELRCEWQMLPAVSPPPVVPPLPDPNALNTPSQVIPLVPLLVVGRDPACDIVLTSPNVSRRHCRIMQSGSNFILEDLKSRHGTFLNGVLVGGPEPLHVGDEVEVGLNRFVFRNKTLEHYAQDGTVRLDITDLCQTVQKSGKPMQLLQNVSFVLPPREFVAIVGASGAGKSTLLNAMTGFRPATGGAILLNGVDFYSHLELFRTIIGYVPQEDIVHRELNVASVLRYAARLRLPPDTTDTEIERLLDSTLAELELSHRKTAPVSTLSGGERKRVNVAVELLTRPSLLFLDEPTSGLDPGLERKFVELVKRLAREGRSIVMVTHATSSIAECDKLLFLARGGRVAFYGPPHEALAFFGVTDYADIYLKVNDNSLPPDHWQQLYLASDYHTRYVREPLAHAPQHRKGQTFHVAKHLGATRARPSGIDQFGLLCRRYLDTFKGDPRNTLFLLAQAPIIALLLALVFRTDTFDHPRTSALLLFCLVISALLFGIVNAAREITKESAIYRRERLVNLRAAPYLLSKVAVLSGLCLLQTLLLVGIVRLRIDFHLEAGDFVAFFITMLLTTLCGMLLGLALSAVATTNDQAMTLVPIAVLPQIVFSGLLGIDSMEILGKLMPSYWAYGALGNVARLPAHAPENHFDITAPTAWIALLCIGIAYGLLSLWLLRRKEKAW
jgi:ABC-type multidrug transport system ATPase subunit/pSer/pThr/pTyr-binding forkhead associated (FHA) protein